MNKKLIKYVGNIGGIITQGRSVYLSDGISPTLLAGMSHGNTMPYIIEEEIMNEDAKIKCVGNTGEANTQSRSVYLDDGISPTLTYRMGRSNAIPFIIEEEENDEQGNET